MAKKIEILENTLLKLLVRRGSNADREDVILSEGELGYTTDTNRLFVGDGVTPGGKIVGNRFLGTSNSVTTFANANVGDLAYDADDRALYAYAGPDPATSINGWTLISSVTDEDTSNIKISVGNLDEGVNNIAGDGVVINNGRLAIDCAGINTNRIAPCTNVNGALELPNTIQYGNNAAYTYSIPARTGSAGKFLVGDNNGNLSWSSDINVGSVTYFSTAEQVIPVGSIVAFADLDAVESNWLICNGNEYDKADYPDLFDIIGYDYGGDDPLFQVPDLRDKVLYGTEDKPTNVDDIEIGNGGDGGGEVTLDSIPIARALFPGNASGFASQEGFSSVVRNSAGVYTLTFATPRADSGYSVIATREVGNPLEGDVVVRNRNPNSFVLHSSNDNSSPGDPAAMHVVVFEKASNSGGGSGGISNASDIINIYGGGGGTSGAFGTTNSIPAGTYLVDVNWIENAASGTDEDTALTVSQKFNIPTGSYLHFANSGIEGFYAITTSQTAPIQSSGDWVNINTLTGFKGATLANQVTAIINGFAIKLDNSNSTTGTAQATPTVYAIKAVTDPVVSSTLTVKSPLTASVDGVLQGENPFNSLEGDIEIGIGQSTISLDDIQMFNFRSKVGVTKGYIEANNSVNDIDAEYRGSLPISFDSGVKFVELKYTSSIVLEPNQPAQFAEDSVNGTIYIDWENKRLKQSSLRKEGDANHYQHWYESTGAESDGIITFNTPDSTPANSAEGIIINWSTRTITGLPAYNRTYSNGVIDTAPRPYEHQYIFRDLTNSGSFGSAGTGGGGGVQLHKTFFAIGSVEDSGATSQAATTSVTPSTLVSSTANAAACWDSYNNTISTDWSSVFTGYNAFNQGNTPSRTELRIHNPIVAEGGTDNSDQSFYDYKVQIDWESNTVIGTALNNGGNSSSGNKMRVLNEPLLSGDNEYAFLRIPTTATNGSSTSPVIRINKELRKITAFPYSEITTKVRDPNIAVEITEYVVSSGTGGGGSGSSLLKYGEINAGNIGVVTSNPPTVGDFTTTVVSNSIAGDTHDTTFECTFNTSLANDNYNVMFEIISNGTDINKDNNLKTPVVFNKTASGFRFNVEEGAVSNIGDNQINVRIESNQTGGGGGSQGGLRSYSSGWVNSGDNGTAVANSADLLFNHNLGSSDLVFSYYVADDASGTNAQQLNDQEVWAGLGYPGALIDNINSTSFELKLGNPGFHTPEVDTLDAGGVTSFAGKYVKVVAIAADATTGGGGGGLKDPNHTGGTFDVDASDTFQDLDLSSIVGSNKAQVTMEIFGGNATGNIFFRRKGSLTDPYRVGGNLAGWGASSVTLSPTSGGTVTVVADASGVIEHLADVNSDSVNYKVLTYQVIS